MSLTVEQKNRLEQAYDALSQYILEDNQAAWFKHREQVITFCVHNDIELDNIAPLDAKHAADLLNDLIGKFSIREILENRADIKQWEEGCRDWKKQFEQAIKENEKNDSLRERHAEAYLTYYDRVTAKGESVDHLLTEKDMIDLFTASGFDNSELLHSTPCSLTELSSDREAEIKALLNDNKDNNKMLFLPLTHDGHWFYLLRKDGQWTVRDSQPFSEPSVFSPRQESIMAESSVFLNRMLDTAVMLAFETSAEQDNDYDCGSRVINAYRQTVTPEYVSVEHAEILQEAFEIQQGYKQLQSDSVLDEEDSEIVIIEEDDWESDESIADESEFTPAELNIINTTASAQLNDPQRESYKNILQALFRERKNGKFSSVENAIDIEEMDTVEAAHSRDILTEDEQITLDEEFAERLQEAEFKKAGL